jgi:2-polyprenyl-3-methyl-5-hydroxy-6-metoxy-1,4-benzoquinol methylase
MNTKTRSNSKEVMDHHDLNGEELERILGEVESVNRLLGGYKVTLDGIDKILRSACYAQPVEIMDVGCGNGNMLREVAKMGRSRGIRMKLTGIDISSSTIEIARKKSVDFPEISYETIDVMSKDFKEKRTDIILCTLTLHHFKDKEIEDLMEVFEKVCQMGIVINDLQRSKLAYRLFKLYAAFFMENEIARKDGLTSILRSFRKEDLEWYGRNLKARKQMISWKWAFRYQWVLLK